MSVLNISSTAISTSQRNLTTKEDDEDESPLPHLIDAILAIGSHSRDPTPTLHSIRPSEVALAQALAPETIQEIISLAFPTGIHTDCFVSMNFTVRVRNKVIPHHLHKFIFILLPYYMHTLKHLYIQF